MDASTQPGWKQQLIEKHRPHWSTLGVWFGFLFTFLVADAALGWAVYSGSTWLALALVGLVAHLMHAHLIAFHEAAHGTLCPHRRLNDAVGMLVGTLSFTGLTAFRAIHHSHHAYLATERDEELWPFVDRSTSTRLRRSAAVLELTLGIFFTPALCLRMLLRSGSPIRKRATRQRIWAELLLIVAVWSGILAAVLLTGTFRFFWWMYALPGIIAGNMHTLRKYTEHMGLTGSTVLASTRSVVPGGRAGRLLARSLFNIPYHGIHHRYARLPQSETPGFTWLLKPTGPGDELPYANYLAAFLAMIRTLGDPRIGAQWLEGCSGTRTVSQLPLSSSTRANDLVRTR